MNILITTLGKGHRDEGGYRLAKYRLPDGTVSRETPFIGLAFLDMLPQIEKMVVLGTPSSIWDAWWQNDEQLLDQHEAFFNEMTQSVENSREDVELLQQLSSILSKHFQKTIECKYIPDGMDEQSQMQILQVISHIGNEGDSISLDVTHGFRHLPMLELLSAFLKDEGGEVGHIYYGAFDKKNDDGVTDIVELNGLLNLRRWIEAIAVLRETGNVMPLSRIPSMEAFRNDMENYQFFIQMNNVGNARGCANRIRGLVNQNMLPPEGELFGDFLLDVFDWGREQDYALRQFKQAKEALAKGDFLRAIILLNESAISAYVQDKSNVLDVDQRKQAQDRLFDGGGRNWHLLRFLRNSTAHDGIKNDRDKWRERIEREVKRMRSGRDQFLKGLQPIVDWVEQIVRG